MTSKIGLIGFSIEVESELKEKRVGKPGGMRNKHIFVL